MRPSFALDASVGADLWRKERRSLTMQADVLNLTGQLVSKSLIVAEEHGAVERYRMLELQRRGAFRRSALRINDLRPRALRQPEVRDHRRRPRHRGLREIATPPWAR